MRNSKYAIMKRICIFFLLLGIISCSDLQRNKFDVITQQAKCLRSEMYLSDEKTLNVYYDLAVLDTCIMFTDYFSDSLLQVRSITDPSYCIRVLYKGNGPDEFVSPYFDKSIFGQEKKEQSFIDVNSRKIAKIKFNRGLLSVKEENIMPEFPLCSSLNKTNKCIYGVDVELDNKGMFFIGDNTNNCLLKRVDYFPEIRDGHKESSLPFLYLCDICVNEKERTVATAMLNMNLIHFYDLEGNLRKTCMIGDKLLYPDSDSKYLDFPDADKFFVHLCGSDEYVFGLYNGTNKKNAASDIFIFDWSGEFVERYKLDRSLHRIVADNSGKYLFGISENAEGGTDILKISIPLKADYP